MKFESTGKYSKHVGRNGHLINLKDYCSQSQNSKAACSSGQITINDY